MGEYGGCVPGTEIRSGILSNVKSEAGWGREITRREKGTLQVGRALHHGLIIKLVMSPPTLNCKFLLPVHPCFLAADYNAWHMIVANECCRIQLHFADSTLLSRAIH